jgi:5'-3' exonuclease
MDNFKIRKKETLVMVDFLNVFYKRLHVHKGLEHNGIPTGGLFGMTKALSSIINNFKPSKIIICSDCPPYFRKLEVPSFKGNRDKSNAETRKLIDDQKKLCREFLNKTGIPFIEIKGLEADDLFALLLDKYHFHFEKIITISNDSDLFQLFKYENFYLKRSGSDELYGPYDFKMDYPEITPAQWSDVLAYFGGHNGLKGIPKVGIVTAIKLLTNKNYYTQNYNRFIKPYLKTIKRDRRLAKLPYDRCKIELVVPPKGNFNSREMIRFLESFGIEYTKEMDQAFDHVHNN